jgi:hypothetical protein
MTRAEVLRRAVRAAIASKTCPRTIISVPDWATTYGVTQKAVRETWEDELTKQTNARECGEGK